MLSEYIGKKQFLEGITLYLKKHLYGNTVTHNLWDGILAASGRFFFARTGTLAWIVWWAEALFI
jgi:aminopeptidase N